MKYNFLKILALIIFFLSLVQLSAGLSRLLIEGQLLDFGAYYSYGKLFLSGTNPYQLLKMFNYPPFTLVFFMPFTFFSLPFSQAVYTLLSLSAVIASVWLLSGIFISSTAIKLLLLALFLQLFPVKFSLAMGQINPAVLLFLTLSFIEDQNKHEVRSGVFYALASMLKVTPITLGLYFLVRKKYKALFTGLLLFIIIDWLIIIFSQISSAYFSKAGILNFFLNTNNTGSLYDQSFRSLLSRLGIINNSLGISVTVALILFATIVYQYLKQFSGHPASSLSDLNFFSLIMIVTTIFNSSTWQHHYIFLIPGFLAEIACLKMRVKKIRSLLLAVSLVLVGYHFPSAINLPTHNPFILSHTLIGGLILIGLLLTSNTTQFKLKINRINLNQKQKNLLI